MIPMDVDKLKKMNVLADTLKQHGLAASREDAANLAGEMVGTPDEQELSRIFVPDEQQSISVREERKMEATEERVAFDEQQVKSILQNFADQFCEEINQLNEKVDSQAEKIESQAAEITRFQQIVQAMKEQPTQNVNLAPAVEQPVQQPEPAPQTEKQPVQLEPAPVQQLKQEAPKENPRSGGFDSSDVSIEKFFYYGQK